MAEIRRLLRVGPSWGEIKKAVVRSSREVEVEMTVSVRMDDAEHVGNHKHFIGARLQAVRFAQIPWVQMQCGSYAYTVPGG